MGSIPNVRSCHNTDVKQIKYPLPRINVLKTSNAVMKAASRGDVNNYLQQCGLIQLVASNDNQGEICIAFTEIGLVTLYFEWGKLIAEHRLASEDYYIQEYSVKGVFICDEIQGFEIPVVTHL